MFGAVDAHRRVVEDDGEDGDVFADGGFKVCADHSKAVVADDVDAELVGGGEFRAHSGAEAVSELGGFAPGDKAARGDGLVERDHLVAGAAGVVVHNGAGGVNRLGQVAERAVGVDGDGVGVHFGQPIAHPRVADGGDLGGELGAAGEQGGLFGAHRLDFV